MALRIRSDLVAGQRWRSAAALLIVIALALTAFSPATAHKEHERQAAAAEKSESPNGRSSSSSGAQQSDAPMMHETMGEMMGEPDRPASEMSWIQRLLNWLGRLHTVIVHFPIAFFPAALFTAVVGHRRPAFAAPMQFLVVAGGVIAPIAALLGWFDAGFDPSTDNWLLQSHRWLGTAIGVGALGLGTWSWRQPDANRSSGMIIGLALISTAIVFQGWFGGALVHGIDHMDW